MFADERTLQALDFAALRERVVAATRSQRGKARAEQLEPMVDFAIVRLELGRTSLMRDLVVQHDLHVMPAIDTADLTAAAAQNLTLAPADLRALGDAIAAVAAAANALREVKHEALAAITAPYTNLRDLHRALTDAIDERGAVLDRASPALGRIRRSLSQAQNDARDRVASILRSDTYARVIQDNVVTIREGRFVVPVKAEFSGEFPGIVHDTSGSGATLFIEPLAALDANNRVRTLRLEEEREVLRVLGELSRSIGAHADAIERNIDMLAQIDVLVAKADVARAMDALEPELVDEAIVHVEAGRHPLLGERAVPQTIPLDSGTQFLVISGPNMGGKTVALKMLGLFVSMTYAGMHVPAAIGTRIGRFARVIADIGDEQSIVLNASSFSAHLARLREMLEVADDRTLVLVDEIGGGTEPGAGAALAIAMLERLLSAGTCGVVTTHATELKLFASGTPGVTNASVRFDPRSFVPTYQLDVGAPGQSLAFPLARALGVPDGVVERAQTLLDTRERDYGSALAELSLRTAELQSEREGLRAQRLAAERERGSLAHERAVFESERSAFADRAEERMQQSLREFMAELQRRAAAAQASRPRVTASHAALLGKSADDLRRELGAREPEAAAVSPQAASFAPNARVHIRSLRQDGTVVEDYGENVLVAIGPMKTVVKKSDLDPVIRDARKRALPDGGGARGGSAAAKAEAAARSTAELDVRGRRFIEAQPLVERWVDEAALAGNSPLRLIHGKGTGMLGRGLQEYLRAHPSVKSVRYGREDEGSGGVTIIELQ
ncbi:MAG TPA: Smr/MutS family protein [Candidatus Baltobacteraceae bacterium]|nr:Smr/MutS family protein [Candidatus Baltobacteraceae bacterium]